jgi:hypothetical protein
MVTSKLVANIGEVSLNLGGIGFLVVFRNERMKSY